MTSTELYRRAETSQHEAKFWRKCGTYAPIIAFIPYLLAAGIVIYQLDRADKAKGAAKNTAHVEMVEQWRSCRQDVPCNVGPFVFTRINPNRYSVEIAGAESTNINRVGGKK